jgi:hypothetical protein
MTERGGGVESRPTRWLRATVYHLIAVVSAASCLAAVAAAQSPTPTPVPRNISISPTVTNISPPTPSATISVLIDNAADINGYTIQVAYDNETAVHFTGASRTGTLTSASCEVFGGNLSRTCSVGSSNVGVICTDSSECTGGTCQATAIVAAACVSTPLSGSGTLFNMTFEGLANGTANLTITKCLITLQPSTEVVPCNVVGGQIVVSGIPTATPTPSLTPTNTSTPTDTPTATSSPTNTPTNTPTDTATATPSVTDTPTQTSTATPTNTSTQTATQTATGTAAPTQTPTNTPTITNTPLPTDTPTNTPTNTQTATPTNTPVNTATPTQTATRTPTNTPVPVAPVITGGTIAGLSRVSGHGTPGIPDLMLEICSAGVGGTPGDCVEILGRGGTNVSGNFTQGGLSGIGLNRPLIAGEVIFAVDQQNTITGPPVTVQGGAPIPDVTPWGAAALAVTLLIAIAVRMRLARVAQSRR